MQGNWDPSKIYQHKQMEFKSFRNACHIATLCPLLSLDSIKNHMAMFSIRHKKSKRWSMFFSYHKELRVKKRQYANEQDVITICMKKHL